MGRDLPASRLIRHGKEVGKPVTRASLLRSTRRGPNLANIPECGDDQGLSSGSRLGRRKGPCPMPVMMASWAVVSNAFIIFGSPAALGGWRRQARGFAPLSFKRFALIGCCYASITFPDGCQPIPLCMDGSGRASARADSHARSDEPTSTGYSEF